MSYLSRGFDIELRHRAAGAKSTLHEVPQFASIDGGEQVAEVHRRFNALLAKQRLERAIDTTNAALRVKRNDTGRNIFEQRLGESDRKSTRLNSSHT